jgi:hypothetical protein
MPDLILIHKKQVLDIEISYTSLFHADLTGSWYAFRCCDSKEV